MSFKSNFQKIVYLLVNNGYTVTQLNDTFLKKLIQTF